MARRAALALLAIFAPCAHLSALTPSGLTVLTIINETPNEIAYLYLAPSDSDSWGADVLGVGRDLPQGADRRFYLDVPEDVTEWDLLAVDAEGDAYIRWRSELESGKPASIEIVPDDFESGYDPPPLARVTITNSTGRDLWFAFLRPSGAPAYGADVLYEGTILAPNERYAVFVPVGDEPVGYELFAMHADSTSVSTSLSLSASRLFRRIVLTDP